MARTIFLFVVLLNLIALTWIYFKGDEPANAGREPQRTTQVLSADKVRLLPAENTTEQQSAVPPAATESCRAFVGATLSDGQVIAKAWMEKLPALRVAVNPVMPPPIFDVVISGLGKRADAETSLAELKKLGVSDGVQIRVEGKGFSLVIASFAARGAAEKALGNAIQKGALSAQIIVRQPEPEQSVIEVRGLEAALAKLPELLSSSKMLRPADCKQAL